MWLLLFSGIHTPSFRDAPPGAQARNPFFRAFIRRDGFRVQPYGLPRNDDQLRTSSESLQRSGSVLANFGGIPWWMASAVAAIVLTLAAVWLWADHMGNTSGKKSGRNA